MPTSSEPERPVKPKRRWWQYPNPSPRKAIRHLVAAVLIGFNLFAIGYSEWVVASRALGYATWQWSEIAALVTGGVIGVGVIARCHVLQRRERQAVEFACNLGGNAIYYSNSGRRYWVEPRVLERSEPRHSGRLNVLTLKNCQLTDEGLADLKWLRWLALLDLQNTQVSDAGVSHLKCLRHLAIMDLSGTRVTDAGAAEIRAALPSCIIKH